MVTYCVNLHPFPFKPTNEPPPSSNHWTSLSYAFRRKKNNIKNVSSPLVLNMKSLKYFYFCLHLSKMTRLPHFSLPLFINVYLLNFFIAFAVHLNSKKFSLSLFTSHMIVPYWLASCSSVYPTTASPIMECLMWNPHKSCQPLPPKTLTLMMATAMFAKMENLQHSTQCISERRSLTISISHGKSRTITLNVFC